MSTKSYAASKRSAHAELGHAIRNLQGEIRRRNEQIQKLTSRSGKTSWSEVGKRQYLGNEVEELKRQNAKDAAKIKSLEKDAKAALALLNEALEIERGAEAFRRKYTGLVLDANQRHAALGVDIKKIDAKIRELEADYNRAGTLDIAAKGFIRDRQKALKAKRDAAVRGQQKQIERKRLFESKIALVDKVTSSGLAGWGFAALGGLFVAANI